ncbi:D type cyclin [Volvox carteri f. nagariensis]|uniref:D type cyclin n=1 Tax=Volvox carteri f. nagariensis TaxID=3068 RepID=D8UBH4_VOLCA|nr:D type cyclin [Volvox carteri f. nagariensis]EFJ42947.1 D type cyclin [Volvox carteri f. nagariensis]|eukprot:XP_002955987.1 D type cyclin [Volvox carteri f. nagariensis]
MNEIHVSYGQADGLLKPFAEHDSAHQSPDCGSISEVSPTRACFSDCTNLLCTEDGLDDFEMGDGVALGSEVHDPCSGHERRLRLDYRSYYAGFSRDDDIIRHDLRKQAEVRLYGNPVGGDLHTSPWDTGLAVGRSGIGGRGGGGGGIAVPCPLLSASYRARMVGWMREVSVALGLQLSTLFTATSVLDRFIAASEVRMYGREVPLPNGLLQLVTLACLSVAVKYGEVIDRLRLSNMLCPPSPFWFMATSDVLALTELFAHTKQVQQLGPAVWLSMAVDHSGRHLYGARDLQRCEFTLLQTINWRLHQPNTYTFLEHFLSIVCSPPAPTIPTDSTAGRAQRLDKQSRWGCTASSDFQAAGDPSVAAASALATQNALTAVESVTVAVGSQPETHGTPEASHGLLSMAIHDSEGSPERCALFSAVKSWRSCGCQEISRLSSIFLEYEHSTVALSCLALAEHKTYGTGGGNAAGPLEASATAAWGPFAAMHVAAAAEAAEAAADAGGDVGPAAFPWVNLQAATQVAAAAAASAATLAAVTTAAGLPLPVLAPCLVSCMTALEGYYQQLKDAAAAEAEEAAEAAA